MPIINMAGALGTGGDASGVIAQQNLAVAGQLMDLMRLKQRRREFEETMAFRTGEADRNQMNLDRAFDFDVERAAQSDAYRAEQLALETQRAQQMDARYDRQLDLREAEYEASAKARALQQSLESGRMAMQVQSGFRQPYPRTAVGIAGMIDAMDELDPTGQTALHAEALLDRYTGGKYSDESLTPEEREQALSALQGTPEMDLLYSQVGAPLQALQRHDRMQDRAAMMLREAKSLSDRIQRSGDKDLIEEWKLGGADEFAAPDGADPDAVLDYFDDEGLKALGRWRERVFLSEEKVRLHSLLDPELERAKDELNNMLPGDRETIGELRGRISAAETTADAQEAFAALVTMVNPTAKMAADFRAQQVMAMPGMQATQGVQMSPQFFTGTTREATARRRMILEDDTLNAQVMDALSDIGIVDEASLEKALSDPEGGPQIKASIDRLIDQYEMERVAREMNPDPAGYIR